MKSFTSISPKSDLSSFPICRKNPYYIAFVKFIFLTSANVYSLVFGPLGSGSSLCLKISKPQGYSRA